MVTINLDWVTIYQKIIFITRCMVDDNNRETFDRIPVVAGINFFSIIVLFFKGFEGICLLQKGI